MPGNPHPVGDITGITTTANVSKAAFVSYVKARSILVMQNAAEINAADLSGQLQLTLVSTGRVYELDTSDTTTLDDGVECIRDANGLGFFRTDLEGFEGPAGAGYGGTSTTSLVTAGSGSKVFTTQAGLAYAAGARVRATSVGTSEWMEGVVASYSGTTLTVTMDLNFGTGTHADWNINTAGERGTAGSAGAGGASALTICRVCATTNVTIASALENGDVVDGVTLVTGNRVLLTGQTAPAENGVYIVPASGAAARDTAFDTFAELAGCLFSIQEGTLNGDTLWRCTSDSTGTINVSAVTITRALRERLTANRTYYVRTDGNDNNSGLVNSAAGAFLGATKAFETIRDTLDMAGFDVTVSIADGTYTAPIVCSRQWSGRGRVLFVGNTGTPANVVINPTGANALSVVNGAILSLVDGMELRTTTSGYALDAGTHGQIFLGNNLRFGAVAAGYAHMVADSLGFINANANYTISGGGAHHWLSFEHGLIECLSRTITLSGTPAFTSSFAAVRRAGHISASGNTYSGSATGPRFSAQSGGSIFTNNAGLTALPGDAAGEMDGGFYDNQVGGTFWNSPSTAAPSGGSTAARLLFGSTSGFGIYYGANAPTISAGQGSLYLRSNGTTTNDRIYVNTNGSTTWTAITTVA